jgi:hypothetical protein
LAGLIDDASALPPAALPLQRAVAEYDEHKAGSYAAIVGSLVVPDVKLPDLIDVLDDRDSDNGPEASLPINVLVTGGAGAIGPAVRWATRSPLTELRAIEFALRDEDDLAHNVQRVLTALDAVEEDLGDVPTYVELPRWDGAEPSHGWLRALDEIAAGGLRVKLRAGGVTADAFPGADALATAIDATLDRELTFRCTGGVHHALTQTDPETGFVHLGFLNLLVGTRACLDGADAVAALREPSAPALLDGMEEGTLGRTRSWFAGFSTRDVLEPHHDLVELGLL